MTALEGGHDVGFCRDADFDLAGARAPYSGTITAIYGPRAKDTFSINTPTGRLRNPLAQYCAFGGPILYTLNLQDSREQTVTAETAVSCPVTVTPIPPTVTPTPTSTPFFYGR